MTPRELADITIEDIIIRRLNLIKWEIHGLCDIIRGFLYNMTVFHFA